MARRHKDALAIQNGACNPSGIAHSIIEAQKEVSAEHGDARKDAAIRLMVHQLAFICGAAEVDRDLDLYGKLTRECVEKCAT